MKEINQFHMKRYLKFIDSHRDKNIDRGHLHHIIPVSMGGGVEPENLVLLTPRQHFIAHRILFKAYGEGPAATAFFMMCNFSRDTKSRDYQAAITAHSTRLSSLCTGVPRSEEVKRKISEGSLGKKFSPEHVAKISIRNKGNQYHLGKQHSEETKEKLRAGRLGKCASEETKEKISKSLLGNSWNKGKPFSEERKAGLRGLVRPPLELKTCPHCGKEGRGNAMYRHHFDNCESLN